MIHDYRNIQHFDHKFKEHTLFKKPKDIVLENNQGSSTFYEKESSVTTIPE